MIRPVDIKRVKIDDRFWSRETELVRKEVIPYQWDILNDRVPDAAPSFCMHNFKAAGNLNRKMRTLGRDYEAPKYTYRGFAVFPERREEAKDDEFYGFLFQDSDFSKWIEAVGYSLAAYPDPVLEETADKAIDIVCDAQLPNGYLDTYYIINGMDKSFSDLRDHHELYCMGHLIEGAVSYYQATGKDKLLNAARRFADYVAGIFGTEEGRINGYPGHEIAEMALFRLYEVTGEERYRNLAEYFIDQRGQEPLYFEKEHPDMKGKPDYYHQAHMPVRKQREAVGHAVRAVYLYSGMADMARITGDTELLTACEALWDSIADTKLYITGGIGGTHIGEAFSFPYDLPNDTAYSETCASIGLIFFARRMLQIKPDRKYSDIMELALYNCVLSGMALDGKSFFYVNPLEVLPEACAKDERKEHVKPVRQKWFGCACCPPNIARLLTSVGSYAYTESEDTLFTHLYMSSKITKSVSGRDVGIRVESGIPVNGEVSVFVEGAADTGFVLALRIPGWTSGKYEIKGAEGLETSVRDGYLYISGFDSDREIRLMFDISPRVVVSDPRVNEDNLRAAVMRGPFVYCAEEADNGKGLRSIRLKRPFEIRQSVTDEFGIDAVRLDISAVRVSATGGEAFASRLYKTFDRMSESETDLKLIPYFLWSNRGEGEMSVFFGY
ncbi:MAG: glycoside hydrolase family 127 protein [Clostridiales bacterium]|nr:glycoside hydrolase family 127 protein [Clostridiales bacterium]